MVHQVDEVLGPDNRGKGSDDLLPAASHLDSSDRGHSGYLLHQSDQLLYVHGREDESVLARTHKVGRAAAAV